jgi:hypothetical protein
MLEYAASLSPCAGAAIRPAGRVARAVAVVLLAHATAAAAQVSHQSPQPEIGVDAIAGRATAFQVAAGAALPTGDYLWLGGDLGFGVVTGHDVGPSMRFDATGRFHPDQNHDAAWGPYLVAGLSYLANAHQRGGVYVVGGIGLHAPAQRGVVPALEVGLGGGLRFGVVIRRAGRRRS